MIVVNSVGKDDGDHTVELVDTFSGDGEAVGHGGYYIHCDESSGRASRSREREGG